MLSPLSLTGVKLGSPEAYTGRKQSRTLKENATCVKSFDSKHPGMFTRGCFDLFVHFWSSIVKWIIAADGCLSCRNLASVPGNISSWSPSFVALPFLHLKALKWKAICQLADSAVWF